MSIPHSYPSEIYELVRDWASKNGWPNCTGGGRVGYRMFDAWIKGHQHFVPEVIEQWKIENTNLRGIKILCYRCARFHTEELEPGQRLKYNSSLNILCGQSSFPYKFMDQLPLMDWETNKDAK